MAVHVVDNNYNNLVDPSHIDLVLQQNTNNLHIQHQLDSDIVDRKGNLQRNLSVVKDLVLGHLYNVELDRESIRRMEVAGIQKFVKRVGQKGFAEIEVVQQVEVQQREMLVVDWV